MHIWMCFCCGVVHVAAEWKVGAKCREGLPVRRTVDGMVLNLLTLRELDFKFV